jgi:serine/threonine-protein kinase
LLSSLVFGPDAILNDRYRLIEQIGEGGMATVYRALDMRLGRTVAIKILHPEFARDQPFLQRFQQEAEFAASLGAHPNIVAIFDIGHDGGLPYIVMELIEGRTLKDLIREWAPFSVDEAFSVGRQVASALDFAHKRGLVHRDIKPQNIMVTGDGAAKVTDFGIAQSVSASQLTRTGMVIGTVHYFSPEQAQGRPAAPASDIYSLGVILYEMLTAHLPFDAENAIGVALKHLHEEPPPPTTYNPELPAGAVVTVMRALEKNPERRYRDAAEFAAALVPPMPSEAAGATTVSPIVPEVIPEPTAVYRAPEPEPTPVVRQIVREPVVRRPSPASTETAPDPWRTAWLALAGLLAVILVAVIAFLLANRIFGASAGTPTPTPTSTATVTPTATPHKTKTPVPTVPAIVPTIPPTQVLPTFTPVPPRPTDTPIPRPSPKPTATSPPPTAIPSPTIQFLGQNTPTPTPTG